MQRDNLGRLTRYQGVDRQDQRWTRERSVPHPVGGVMRKEDPERPAGMNDPREMTTVDGQVPVRHSAKAPWVVHSVGAGF